jgi:hypothetical protein
MANLSIKTGIISRSMLVGNPAFQPGAFESIATVSGNGSAQTLTLSSIPSTYTHLQLRGMVRNDRNNGSFPFGNLSIYFNGTEGSNANHYLRGDGANATAAGNTGITALTIGSTATDAQTSNVMTAFIIDIQNYKSTTQNKTVRSFIGTDVNGTGRVELSSALSLSTSAVSSITMANYNGAAFTSASVFSLYGIKG